MLGYIIPIIALSALSAGWAGVQFLARKMKTKNHFDDINSSCGNCTCGGVGSSCELSEESLKEIST